MSAWPTGVADARLIVSLATVVSCVPRYVSVNAQIDRPATVDADADTQMRFRVDLAQHRRVGHWQEEGIVNERLLVRSPTDAARRCELGEHRRGGGVERERVIDVVEFEPHRRRQRGPRRVDDDAQPRRIDAHDRLRRVVDRRVVGDQRIEAHDAADFDRVAAGREQHAVFSAARWIADIRAVEGEHRRYEGVENRHLLRRTQRWARRAAVEGFGARANPRDEKQREQDSNTTVHM
jgi:hypothetical protein